MALPVKRPMRKQRKPNEARLAAALLLKPRDAIGMSLEPAGQTTPSWPADAVHSLGHRRHLRRHVVDEETEDPGLGGDVEELRQPPP